ncbi:twin-arginine translocation signal domain-containing protein [Actinomadura roseirufa]|uniref:twin-arginine translocation signal domain-containing protein n=1 Tax=Actinomadura roseirufa TaxID=2094049 RepID=UPI0010412632|nr:twin-arginine translocation signal domain-containing protein [Actinomadura roseirufa]
MTTSPVSRRTVLTATGATGVAASLSPLLSTPANAAPAPSSGWRDVTASLGADFAAVGTPVFLGPHEGWLPVTVPEHAKFVMLRWNGRRWTPWALPEVIQSNGGALAVSSRRKIWYITLGGHNTSYFYDGTEWRAAELPLTPPVAAEKVAAIPVWFSPESLSAGRDGTAWVALADAYHDMTAVMHWDGSAWVVAKVPLPLPYPIATRVAVRSHRDIWVAGHFHPAGHDQPFTLHWDGHSWTDVVIPPVEGGAVQVIRSVVPVSKNLAWAFRSNAAVGQHQTLLRWRGGKSWEEFLLPEAINFTGPALVEDGQGGVWLGDAGRGSTQYAHFRDGAWKLMKGPARADVELAFVTGLARVPGTRTIFATGSLTYRGAPTPDGYGSKPFVERLH